MIAPSEVSDDARAYIRQRLNGLAAREGVRILFAVESGSRAWGFPSADSDYDVRFVYVRPQADYLSVREFRDVIETPLIDDPVLGVPFDLNGWDIRKALRLALTSNPVLYEWLTSPVIYMREHTTDAVQALAAQAAAPEVFRYHYDRLCRSAWNQMQEADGATIKRHCYALRPTLMLKWLGCRKDLPPMDMHSLCDGLDIDQDVLRDMADLFDLKQSGGESDIAGATDRLNDFISEELLTVAPRPEKIDPVSNRFYTDADDLFLRILET